MLWPCVIISEHGIVFLFYFKFSLIVGIKMRWRFFDEFWGTREG